ncbi:MAG: Na+/H+ antiporter NhaC family protein [Acidobacteriota bacterium]
MESFGWLSIIPPLVAIALALITRHIYISLFLGIYSGELIISKGRIFYSFYLTLEEILNVFSKKENVQVIFFCMLVGSLIALAQRSGGIEGLINYVTLKGIIKTKRKAQALAGIIGVLVFIESSITSLIVGSIFRPIFDKLKISREKLAYICDSTSAPVCMMIPLNGWGAFVIGLLLAHNIKDPVHVLIKSLPLNFYSILAILMVFIIAFLNKDFGPMKKAEERVEKEGKIFRDGSNPLIAYDIINLKTKEGVKPNPFNLIIPVFVMISIIPCALYISGNGNIFKGSGSTSVLWSVLISILIASVIYLIKKNLNIHDLTDLIIKGMSGLLPVTILVVFAYGIGSISRELHTGEFVASQFSRALPPFLLPAILFAATCFIAFATGTSWGSFAIMVPIGISAAINLNLSIPLVLSAILGGGVFGDHASPLSDTTIISAMSSASDLMDHVTTQLPYALFSAGVSLFLYILIGILFV